MNAPAHLEQARSLTERMVTAADAGDWDTLDVLESERRPLLIREHPAGADTRNALTAILAADRHVMEEVRSRRDAVASSWAEHRRTTSALAAYHAPGED